MAGVSETDSPTKVNPAELPSGMILSSAFPLAMASEKGQSFVHISHLLMVIQKCTGEGCSPMFNPPPRLSSAYTNIYFCTLFYSVTLL